ncbi:MAG: FxDxF family PEP-CTERM protein [Pseudomonadota bacterium]
MTATKLIKTAAIAALLAGGSACAAPLELLSNGGFEADAQGYGSWANYASLSGWSGGDYGIELRNNVAGTAAAGVNFVELDTYHNSSLWQTINTVSGQTYTLSFQFQDRAGVDLSSQGLNVSWGGISIDSVNGSANWTTRTYTLIGDGTAKQLKFTAVGTDDSLGTSLDNVSLTTAVPEPETYAMLLAGLSLVGFATRRRKMNK